MPAWRINRPSPAQIGISSMGHEGIGLFFIGKNTLA
jgi:hypothetical protein